MRSSAEPRPILRDESPGVQAADLLEAYPDGKIFACDFYITGAERGLFGRGGIQLGRILNVDHHAPLARLQNHCTSTSLAFELRVNERAARGDTVVINHTDCDSVLSSALLLGLVPDYMGLLDAAVAADHTGMENELADALQAIDELRNYELSLAVMRAIIERREIPSEAQEHLRRRRLARKRAKALVLRAQIEKGVALIVSDEVTDGEFFPGYMSEVEVIVIACPHPSDPSRRAIKIRRGREPGAPSLDQLGIEDFDPAYGGRWNAGSNKRGGGTTLDPDTYAAAVRDLLAMAHMSDP